MTFLTRKKSIILTDNKINYDGIKAISEGFGKYAALRVLDLSNNGIGKNLSFLKKAFKASAAVTELNLSGKLSISHKLNSILPKPAKLKTKEQMR